MLDDQNDAEGGAVAQLRADEAEVQAEVRRALERENAEAERQSPGGLDSRQLEQEMADVRKRVERHRRRWDDLEERVGNAIEIAIICKAKRFLKSAACQKVIDSIWRYGIHMLRLCSLSILYNSGRCVYQAESSHSILADVRAHQLALPRMLTVMIDLQTAAHPILRPS